MGHSGAILAYPGPCWGHLGPSWGFLGTSWGHLGAILRPSWVNVGSLFGGLGHQSLCFRAGETLICRTTGSKIVLPSRRNVHFRILGLFVLIFGRIHATKLFTLSALPVPMLGQVYLRWCFRRGETLIFEVRWLKVVLPSRRNAHFRILGHLGAILGYRGGTSAILGPSWVI